MNVNDARIQFIEAWGAFATQWGINRAMAQIHALLLVSVDPITADDIMDKLSMSRGNVSMNLRALQDWGIVSKYVRTGERREYFVADKDIWAVARKIMSERKKRELDPVVASLRQLQTAKLQGTKQDVDEFMKVIKDITEIAGLASTSLDTLSKADSSWLVNLAMKVIK
ncbi:MAG: ArsR family transcriptional regulator [Candidatus Kapabacteria bacterium]|jgi:DNA-binding transcriptional regulator GbsR (MarR family)|nr:ArsR family transcriptional regulator [Candidatus Kapabacteria bacterium]